MHGSQVLHTILCSLILCRAGVSKPHIESYGTTLDTCAATIFQIILCQHNLCVTVQMLKVGLSGGSGQSTIFSHHRVKQKQPIRTTMVMNYTLNKAVCVRHMAAESEYDVFSVYRHRSQTARYSAAQTDKGNLWLSFKLYLHK